MKNKTKKVALLLFVITVMMAITCFGASAAETFTDGNYTYTVKDGEATITDAQGLSGKVEIPETLGGYPVICIGEYAFSDSEITSVIIPEGVTTIGEYAFEYCELTDLFLPSTLESAETAFYYCSADNVYISDLAKYCALSFTNAKSSPIQYADLYLNGELVTDLVIPDGVTSIGDYAFYYCRNISSITIPKSLKSIGKSGLAIYKEDYYDIYISNIEQLFTLNIDIYGDVYFNGKLLTELVVPEGITSIPAYAFQDYQHLSSLVIHDSVTSIGAYAFDNCEDLRTVKMGKGISSIGSYAFSDCNITDFYMKDLKAWLNIKTLSSNPLSGVKNLYIDNKLVTELTIPEGITTINAYAFSGCKAILTVKFPDSLTTIKEGAFYGNTNLCEITLGKNITDIEEDAFSYCPSVSSITLNENLSNVHQYAFSGCKPEKVFISDLYKYLAAGMKSPAIGSDLYLNGKIVENLVIPEGITEIKKSAFEGYTSLRSVTIPSHVKSIGDYAFSNCENITSLTFEEGVTYIGKSAFSFISVTELILPESLTSSGETAFTYIDTLAYLAIPKSYKIPSPDYSWQTTVFGYSMDNLQIVHYTGNQDDWKLIGEKARWPFNSKTIHYNCLYEAASSSSCYQAGFTKGVYCNDCNGYAVGHKEITGTGHSYTTKIQTPTCTKEGCDVHTCTICGEVYTDNRTEPKGHSFDNPYVKEATCSERGYKSGYCSICRDYFAQMTPTIPHSYIAVVTPATCTQKGYTTYTCVCGDSYFEVTSGTADHTYTSVTTPATCTANGKTVYTCVCGDSYTEIIPTTGHDYQNGICTKCGDNKTDDCSHMCHKGGFMGFIWKIVQFFWKLFKMNPVCECGAAHY